VVVAGPHRQEEPFRRRAFGTPILAPASQRLIGS
jgi:hypothetical protein